MGIIKDLEAKTQEYHISNRDSLMTLKKLNLKYCNHSNFSAGRSQTFQFIRAFSHVRLFTNLDHLLWRTAEEGASKENLENFLWIL